MTTHTFIADSADAVVQQIRAELGPNAVALSVRKLPRHGLSRLLKKERIEVVARGEARRPASDRGAAARPGETPTFKPPFKAARPNHGSFPGATGDWLAQFLHEQGILPRFRDLIASALPPQAAVDHVGEVLRSKWRNEPHLNDGVVHLFVGVPGSGKSTVLCKMLAQTSLVGEHPATLYQLDAHVTNSSAKPAIFAEIVGAHHERALPAAFERREESVFVDLPGVALGDEKGLQALRPIIQSFGVPEIHLVLNGAYEACHLLEQARFFSELGISDVIVSHLDEEPRWSKVWNLILGTNFAVRYLSSGQNVPGGLHPASPDLLLPPKSPEK